MHNIYLIVGRSGSGKDTVTDYLCEKYGYKRIFSYTTRAQRNAQDKHIFVSDTEFDKLKDIVAYTEYGGHRYCATSEQVEEADLYVIDIDGVRYFKQHYKGDKGIKVIGLHVPRSVAKQRMEKRGDTEENIEARLSLDDEAFLHLILFADVIIESDRPLERVAWKINKFIKS